MTKNAPVAITIHSEFVYGVEPRTRDLSATSPTLKQLSYRFPKYESYEIESYLYERIFISMKMSNL